MIIINTRKDILERKDDILKWISENRPKAYICRELKCKPATLNSYLEKMGIVYKGNMSQKGYSKFEKRIPIEKYLNNEKCISTYKLKNKLLEYGIKQCKCEKCGLSEWLGVQIPLELHHIDGDTYNNNIENLEILCPNCHALTEYYRGRGIKKYREKNIEK